VFGEGSPEIEEPELKTIDTLLSEYAKELLRDNREKANSMLRNATAEEVQKTASHRNVRYTINTFTANTAKSRIYDTAFAELKTYSKRLQKDILEAIEERREGSTYSGLLRGKRLDTRAISRNDGKIFKDNKLPGDEAELVVSVLIDQSGSMSGIKIAQAMKAAMIIEDFCRGLDIPVSIMGHCVSGGVVLNQYIDFGDDSHNRKYKLCELYAGGCNRDGFALRYAIKQLESRDEPTKLLILISDGLPNDYEYSGRVAETDLQECVADCNKKDIIFFAAAIDQDKEQIKRIYGNSFLDITDLATFPKKMVNIIKRFAVQ
jgi:nitric oxide reductase activation protein